MALTASELDAKANKERLRQAVMALEALRNVIKNNPGTEAQCIGHFKMIFSLLRITGATTLQQYALEVISGVTSNKNCVNSIADSEILGFLLLTLHTLTSSQLLTVDTLHALCSNTKIVKEAMYKGALIYLMDLFCNGMNPTVRERSAELFAKMMSDKLIGPHVKIILSKFLPPIFMDAMRDSAEACVHMFEATHENPELIWNDEAREKVCGVVKELKDRHYHNQRENLDIQWKLPDDFTVKFNEAEGELTIGGVYLRLFIQQPAWVLRNPKEFLHALLEKFVETVNKTSPDSQYLETITQAVLCLFTAQPTLADQIPGLGHIPAIFKSMGSSNNGVPKSAVQVIHVLSDNEICVRSMAATNDGISYMIKAMESRPDVANLVCEALYKMFEKNHTELVAQAVKFDLVKYLLNLLDGKLEGSENPAATKAQIVKALKAMTRDLTHGEEVNKILEASSIWASYRDQKHDLFISDRPIAGYLTGSMGAAGYLTMGPNNPSNITSKPPPVEHKTTNGAT
ncbi:dnaJ homolog subfamily C member 13-like [Actinia tenebrosa]|uniref:DnaJ homolog subfamily C member 13-like n=1 Tax=Actinia tenebrosa TaxID=6105 RepID=A0A6P8IXI7_ACTTE|nr:dnaJ homolog subfamily C member 13-like [Actinia tenebrosa]